MTKQTRKVLLVLLAIYCVPVFLVGTIAYLALRPLPPLVPLPNPNAYDDLVKAGGLVATNNRNYARMTADQLRPFVAQNAKAVALAREALDSPCRVPLQYSQQGQQTNASYYPKLQRLAQAFAAEGRLAYLDHRPRAAAECDLDLVRLGADVARGGMVIDAFVGSSIESLGTADFPKLMNQLDAPTCREAALTLEAANAERAPWPEVLRQQEIWIRRTFGWKSVVVEFVVHRQMKRWEPRARKNYQIEQAKSRQLMINLAARAYELEKGHHPASNADLVPEYLKASSTNAITGNK
jgi:hypothetical protein